MTRHYDVAFLDFFDVFFGASLEFPTLHTSMLAKKRWCYAQYETQTINLRTLWEIEERIGFRGLVSLTRRVQRRKFGVVAMDVAQRL